MHEMTIGNVRSNLVLELALYLPSKVALYFYTFNLKLSLLSVGKLKVQAADQSGLLFAQAPPLGID